MTKFLLLTHDFDWSAQIRAALPQFEDDDFYATDRIIRATFADTIEVLDKTDPAVVVIGPDVDSGTALGLTRALDARMPTTSVVLIADPQPAFLERAVRAGARDVIDPFAEPEEVRVSLTDTLERATRRRRALRSHAADAPPAWDAFGAGREATEDPERAPAEKSAHGRVVRPLLRAIVKYARRLTPAGIVEGAEHRVDAAGLSDCPLDRLLTMKLTGGVLGGVFGLLCYLASPSAATLAVVAILAVAGFVGPDVWITRRASNPGFRSSRLSVTSAGYGPRAEG